MMERRCIVINIRSALTIVLIFICGGIRNSETAAGNQMTSDNSMNESTFKNNINNNDIANNNNPNPIIPLTITKTLNDTNIFCAGNNDIPCSHLEYPCIRCNYAVKDNCNYGKDLNVTCSVFENVQCLGERFFQRVFNCRYCYQTELWQQSCVMRGNCNFINEPHYRTNCTVHSNVLCLGNRSFPRNMRCNWTQGYRWSTALLISLTLGGFGADRFYLGHWQEGIGKLFSFGGLGVWTIIDVMLISLHYLGPADGSLYI